MANCKIPECESLKLSEKDRKLEQEFADLAKALAHPARVRIIKILFELDAKSGCLNGDLVGELGLAQSTVSEHLRVLRQAGLISSEPKPPKVCYRIENQALNRLQQLFETLF